MKSIRDYKLDPNKLCKKLQTTTINDVESTPSKTSNVINTIQKKKKTNQTPLHWSTYKFNPNDRPEKLSRLKNNNSARELRNLIINNKSNGLLPPCYNNVPHLSYCLLCGSPGHTIDQCNPNHRYLKYLKDDKGDGASTSRELATSNVNVNNGVNLKKSFKPKKQYDTSLHQVALPFIESDMKKNCKVNEDEIEREDTKKSHLISSAEVEKQKWEMLSGPNQKLFKTKKNCNNKNNSLKNGLIGVSKTTAQQGAQMHFQMQNHHNSSNLGVVAGNNRCRIKKSDLPSSNKLSSCLNGYSSSSNEPSVAIICGTINGIETNMLIDTGSSISAITETFAQQLKLETWLTRDTLVVTLANTHIERYPERTCLVTLKIGDLETYEEFNVLPDQIYNITLGKSWLKRHKVICDYGLDLLQLRDSRLVRIGFPPPLEPLPNNSIIKDDEICTNKFGQKAFCKFLRF